MTSFMKKVSAPLTEKVSMEYVGNKSSCYYQCPYLDALVHVHTAMCN